MESGPLFLCTTSSHVNFQQRTFVLTRLRHMLLIYGDNDSEIADKSGMKEYFAAHETVDSDLSQLSQELAALELQEKQLEIMTAIESKKKRLTELSEGLKAMKNSSVPPAQSVSAPRQVPATATDRLATNLLSSSSGAPSTLAPSANIASGFGLTGAAAATFYYSGNAGTKYKKIVDYIPVNNAVEEEEYPLGESIFLKVGAKSRKLLNVTPAQWIAANTKILMEMIAEMSSLPHQIASQVVHDYLVYTTKVGELATRFTWASVLLFDDDYRRRQAELDFRWGSDAPHLSMVVLKERPVNSKKPGEFKQPKAANAKSTSSHCGYFNQGKECPYGVDCKFPHVCAICGKKSQQAGSP